MKNISLLTIVSAFLFVSCNKESQPKTQTTKPSIEALVSEWKAFDFTGDQTPPYPSLQLKKFEDFDASLVMLEKALEVLKSNNLLTKDFERKITDYKPISSDGIHQGLLNLKGRHIDIIGMEHLAAIGPDNQNTAIACQVEIIKIIQQGKYDVVFTEDFSSDVGPLTKSKIIQDFKREAIDAGFTPKNDFEVEQIVYQPLLDSRGSASIEIFEHHPEISVVGVDYYPVKRIQQHFMSAAESLNLDQKEGDDLMSSFSFARDLYLLRYISTLKEFSDKKCVIVFGARHVPHLAKLLKSYGASGTIRIQKSVIEDPFFIELAHSWGLSF
jgi:hypothetical protein